LQKEFKGHEHYELGFKINEIFKKNLMGIITARDHFTIKETKDEVINTIKSFVGMENEKARGFFDLGPDVRDWKIEYAKKDIINTKMDATRVVKINYRPFDLDTHIIPAIPGAFTVPQEEKL
jgi:hypothetical protein